VCDLALLDAKLELFYPLNALSGMKKEMGGVLSNCVRFLGSGELKNENCLDRITPYKF